MSQLAGQFGKIGKITRRLWGIAARPHYHTWSVPLKRCNICEKTTVFMCDEPADRWIRKCMWCHSTPKYRAIAKVVEDRLGQPLSRFLDDPGHAMYELSTTSALYRRHSARPNYACSGFFPDQPFQREVRPRVWNEDVQDLHFADASFDVVISSETFEHVRRPWHGFAEIYRVLKPGGLHCFTIPYRAERLTTARVDTSGAEDVHLLPKAYHKDPYCAEGCLVYTDFGRDLPELLQQIGFHTTEHGVWDEWSDIRDDLKPVRVFLSEKPK